MNTEQQQPAPPPPLPQPPQDPPPADPPAAGWGAPPPANRPKWTVRRTVLAVAVALGIAAAGGVAVYAASGSTNDNQVGPGGGPGRQVGPGGGPGGMGGPVVGGPLADAEHGEFQNGEVTAISDTSITAKSDDGYTRTYVIDSDTALADGIAKGDDVTIMATTASSGDEATATMVAEQGQGMVNRRDGQNGAPPNGTGGK